MEGHCPQQGKTENRNGDHVYTLSKCNQYQHQCEKLCSLIPGSLRN